MFIKWNKQGKLDLPSGPVCLVRIGLIFAFRGLQMGE